MTLEEDPSIFIGPAALIVGAGVLWMACYLLTGVLEKFSSKSVKEEK